MSWIREADEEPIPGYRLIKPLGSGGFGEVWLCEAPGKILKAIKFVFGNLDATASGDGRARQEFHALQRVKEVRHPFVLSIERIDILDGEVAIVMELAEKSLYDVLQERRQEGHAGIPRDKLLRYTADAADGLDYLSETHNLMHLDVKPRNLFLVGDHVKVADFGLAKHLERQSSSGIMAGISPQYAAPETFATRITKFSDQYSLAIVYTELMTGRRPFTGKTIRELALQHMNADPDLSGLPERDRKVVAKALAKDPFKRFPSCQAFVQAFPRGLSQADMAVGSELPPTKITGVGEMELPPPTQKFDTAYLHGQRPAQAPAELSGLHKTSLTAPTAEGLTAPTRPVKDLKAVPYAEVVADGKPARLADSHSAADVPPESEAGVLRPTLVIGVGGFGLLALKELRSRLTDRVGDLRNTPAFRFLYLDADPQAKTQGTTGSPDRALMREQVFPTPLQPVARYRRAALDVLTEWLPREKLHAIPRNMHPQGSRALGRLAFTENYLRFVTRVRRELEIASHPESVARTADHSGLAVRDTRPRVFVLAAAGGGSSGALPDIGYAVTKLLTHLKLPGQVAAFLYVGSPADPTTPPEEGANVYATLTELNHYADESITFRSRYGGPDGPQVESPAAPFSTVYLLQRGGRGPNSPAESAERLASYLCLDLTTPLGADLDRTRHQRGGLFRSFGTGGVWFPRGLLLRSSARHVCELLIQQWQTPGPVYTPAVDEVCKKVLADPSLRPDKVVTQIADAARAADAGYAERVDRLFGALETKIGTPDVPASDWAEEAFEAVLNLVGAKAPPNSTDSIRTGRLTKVYTAASTSVAEAWVKKLAGAAMTLLETPGRRIGSAEAALARMVEFCDRSELEAGRTGVDAARRSEQAYADARAAAEVCASGGRFTLFGNKDLKHMRALLAALVTYANARTQEEAQGAASRFFRRVKAGLEDKSRDLAICRQRLTHLRRALEVPETAGASISGGPSPTVELLLPDGGQEIEWAAKRFVETIPPQRLSELDQALQALVLESRGGLFGACQKSGDFIQELADPLIDQTSAFLGNLLTVSDVTAFPTSRGSEWEQRLQKAFDRSSPTVSGVVDRETDYLLVPDTAGGERVAQVAGRAFAGLAVLRSSGSNEVTFCREIRLRPADVREAMQYCREPYEQRAGRPLPSPHARFDVIEWLPLDA